MIGIGCACEYSSLLGLSLGVMVIEWTMSKDEVEWILETIRISQILDVYQIN